MATLAELIVKVGADATQFEKHMNKIERTLNKTSRTLTDVGSKLTTGLTLPLAAAGGGALKASIDFESAFAGVRKTVDATEEELQQMRKGILDMAGELPATATEIAAIAEAAGQLGIQTDAILGFTKTIVDLGVSTNLAGEEAATMLARFANITQMPQDEFDRLGATLVALGNAGASTEREIMEMALRIAGAGAQVGMTEPQILAIANALSSVGIEAEAGGSAISRVMIQIANAVANGGEELEAFASVAGMSAEEFAAAWKEDAASALATFIEGLARIGDEGGNVFAVLEELGLSEIRVRDALLRAANAGDLFRSSLELGTRAWEENMALVREAEQRYATTESRLAVLRNQLVNIGITLGDALAPALSAAITAAQPFIDTLRGIAEWFAALDPGTQRLIINFLLAAAAIGPLLVAIGKMISTGSAIVHLFGSVGTKMMSLIGTGGKLMEAFALWRGGAGTFAEALGLVVSPAGMWVAAITGVIAVGYLLWRNWDEISAWLTQTWQRITSVAQQTWTGLANWFTNAWQRIKEGIVAAWNAIADFFREWWGTILLGIVTGGLGLLVMIIAGNWETIKQGIITAWTTITETLSQWAQAAWNAVVNALISLPGWLSSMWANAREWTAQAWQAMVQTVVQWVQNLKSGMIQGLEDAWTYLKSLPGRLWEWGKSAIRGFVEGFLSIKIPIPKFGIEWKEGPLGVKIPSLTFGVNWKDLRSFIPFLAEGGIVTAPTLAMIGEAGPEAVVPLSKMDRYGAGGVTVNINWSSLARPSDSEIRQVAQLINRELGRMVGAMA